MRVRDALIGALAVGLVAGGSGLAAASTAPTAAGNLAAAQAEATRLLTLVQLPPGVVSSATEPAGDGGVLGYPPQEEATTALVDSHSWWTTTESPDAVLAYFAAHVPAGATLSGSGRGDNGPTGPVRSAFQTYSLPAEPGVLSLRLFGVTVAQLPNGITGVRADGEAVWILPRPPWERIPAGVDRIEIIGRGASGGIRLGPPSAPITVTGAQAGRVISLVNAAAVVQPYIYYCPVAVPASVSLRFIGHNGATVARAVEQPTGCASISLTIGDQTGPPLSDYPSISDELLRLGAIPTCAASSLAKASSPFQESGPNAVPITLENRSDLMCRLPPFPRIALLDAAGHRIPTTDTDAGARSVRQEGPAANVILDPRQSATFFLSYRNCHKAPVAARARITLPGATGLVLFPLGSRRRPLAPCGGRLTVDTFLMVP